ncbi:type VI secretion system Vgr family protein [Roseomonas sp. HF4]|uniref:type VI secretion system Vgr family protein n=1 Tax=Roseomonas sp. HF4 TaxID=2562313 RepID=UPI0010C072A1|nr:type VI secretion system tip protein TssI/VgrG [Roseomonas sp. HF4]
MTDYDQASRILAIDIPALGTDKAVLVELEGVDAISQPYEFRIRFATEEAHATVAAALGTAVTLTFGRPGDSDTGPTGIERRPLHGMIRRLTRSGASRGDATEWQAEVVPKLWFLSRTTDCRIFQEQTVPQIVETILGEHGVTFRNALTGTYAAVPYCVQYRETTLAFVSRLMEQAGIAYWHEHTDSAHTMVLSDANNTATLAAWPDLPVSGRAGTAAIRALDEEFAVRSGTWTLRDFNFETPSNNLEVEQPTTIDTAMIGDKEFYDYPGLYGVTDDGRTVAGVQIGQEEALHQRGHGTSGVAGLNAGLRFKIADIDDTEVLVTEVRHVAQDRSHWTAQMWGGREPVAPSYDNTFVSIPKRVAFRPPRVTPKTFVRGPQTAIVTGPSGDEIHTDQYGRVKVKFHWDRATATDDTTSCWLRVSQGWAGAGWGQMHIPRVGQEVIVDFLEGDPDRPIVTGRVYNAESTVPYALPDNKTQSGIKSRSSPDGTASTFNELRFEDKKGEEQVYFQAERDLVLLVKNARTETINEGDLNGDDTYTLLKGNKVATVSEGNYTLTVAQGNMTVDVTEGNETRTVGQGNYERTVSQGNMTIGVDQGDYALTLGQGNVTISCDAGSATIEAMQEIVLKVGANKVTINTQGVTVEGMMVEMKGTTSAKVDSPMTTAGGSGMTKVTGSAIMIG